MTTDADILAAITKRYAQMVEGSWVEVRYVSGWHYVIRVWADEYNTKPIRIGHARSLINAENIAQQFEELDARAAEDYVATLKRAA